MEHKSVTEVKEGKEAFGFVLKAWRAECDFQQSDITAWKESLGINLHNSQWSNAENAKIDPKPFFWKALGEFNKNLDKGDFRFIKDKKARESLSKSFPLKHDNGKLFTAMDFLGLFLGEVDPPHEYRVITKGEAKNFSESYRDIFEAVLKKTKIQRRELAKTWQEALVEIGVDKYNQEIFTDVVIHNMENFTPEQMKFFQGVAKGTNLAALFGTNKL